MKVIFLDIDGVLNSKDDSNVRKLLGRKYSHDEHNAQLFDERCCRWLQFIILKSQAKIVISSTWKLKGLQYMKDLWEKRGLAGEIIDVTPVSLVNRTVEIEEWLLENDWVTNYCIIDDTPIDNIYAVKCDNKIGLNYETCMKALAYLGVTAIN